MQRAATGNAIVDADKRLASELQANTIGASDAPLGTQVFRILNNHVRIRGEAGDSRTIGVIEWDLGKSEDIAVQR